MSVSEQEQRGLAVDDLKSKIARWTEGCERFDSPIPGLYLFQIPQPTGPKSVISEPNICLIAQGAKRLRLQEARRLMLSDELDAASAGFQVGYESASQFSREYGRHFGAPPLTDIRQLKETASV